MEYKRILVRFSQDVYDEIKRRAKALGLGVATYVQMIINKDVKKGD